MRNPEKTRCGGFASISGRTEIVRKNPAKILTDIGFIATVSGFLSSHVLTVFFHCLHDRLRNDGSSKAPKSSVVTFQDIILSLQRFWKAHQCILTHPYDTEKGAGTFNPSTFLRTLGPEPWRAAYVEPCRRPTDGRYGNNPNRLQHYFQYQVVLKPAPPNSQDLYLESLSHLGLDPYQHDIQFLQDDWESPTLGAWARFSTMALISKPQFPITDWLLNFLFGPVLVARPMTARYRTHLKQDSRGWRILPPPTPDRTVRRHW